MSIPDGNLVYLASPYTKYLPGIEAAFIDTAKIAAKLLKAGVKVYSPIVHCHPISVHGNIDPLDHGIWLPFNEAMLIACDVLIVAHMDGWQDSYGVGVEIKHFEDSQKPIFDLDPATMTMSKRKPPGITPLKRLDEMTIEELQNERAHWDAKIRNSKGWGAGLTAAAEFRDECDSLIARKIAAGQAHE